MNVSRTLDAGIILKTLMDETIFEAISEDNATIEDIKIDVFKDKWLEVVDDSGDEWPTIGIVQFRQVFTNAYDAHIHILPQYRKKHSLEAGAKILDWCEEHIPGSTLMTNVPVTCPNVKDWLMAFNFIETGYLERVWTKGGERIDMWILTREIN